VTSRPTNELCLVKGSNRDIDRYSIDIIGNAITQGDVPSGTPSWSIRWGSLPGRYANA